MIIKALTVSSLLSLVAAHGIVKQVILNDQTHTGPYPNYGDDSEIKSKGPIRQVTNTKPIKDIYSPNLSCGRDSVPSEYSAPVAAGTDVEFIWNGGEDGIPWPHSTGPIITYMGNCNGDCKNVDPTTIDFFKISEDDKRPDGMWEQATLKNFNTVKATVPWDIASGNYMIRHEIIALHEANMVGGCEFYPSCINVQVQGGGDAYPSDTVKFPGGYNEQDPGIYLPNMYDSQQGITDYQQPGPALQYTATKQPPTFSSAFCLFLKATSSSSKSFLSFFGAFSGFALPAALPLIWTLTTNDHHLGMMEFLSNKFKKSNSKIDFRLSANGINRIKSILVHPDDVDYWFKFIDLIENDDDLNSLLTVNDIRLSLSENIFTLIRYLVSQLDGTTTNHALNIHRIFSKLFPVYYDLGYLPAMSNAIDYNSLLTSSIKSLFRLNNTYTLSIWVKGVGLSSDTPNDNNLNSHRALILSSILAVLSPPLYSTPQSILPIHDQLIGYLNSLDRKIVLVLLSSLLNTSISTKQLNYLPLTPILSKFSLLSMDLLLVLIYNSSSTFSKSLSKLHRSIDFDFILTRSLSIIDESSAPNYSLKAISKSHYIQNPNVLQLWLFLWRLIDLNPKFKLYLSHSNHYLSISTRLITALNTQSHNQNLLRLLTSLLHSLSFDHNFGSSLDNPISLQDGNHGLSDYLVSTIYNLVTSSIHPASYDSLLAALANLGGYLKHLSQLSAVRLVSIYRALATPQFLFANKGNPRYLFYILEAFNGVIHRQLNANPSLIYALLLNNDSFQSLANLTLQKGLKVVQGSRGNSLDHENPTTSSPSQVTYPPQSIPNENEMSEKAKGKQAERVSTSIDSSRLQENKVSFGGDVPKMICDFHTIKINDTQFEPTEEWVRSWVVKLPLDSILLASTELLPIIRKESVRSTIISELRNVDISKQLGNQSKLLDSFHWTEALLVWRLITIWSDIYINALPNWSSTSVKLFGVTIIPQFGQAASELRAHWDQFDVQRAPDFPPSSQLQPTINSNGDDDLNNQAEEHLPEVFPPAFGHHTAVQIRNFLYLPYLSVNPSVYVLNLTTRLWDRYFLRIDSPNYYPTQSYQWQPLMAPVTAYNDEIYIFGGTLHPKLSSDHPTHATAALDERSTGSLSDILYKINIKDLSIVELGNSRQPDRYLNRFSKRPRKRTSHSSESYEESTWPTARRGHSMACIRDFIVLFGGICDNTVGDNDVFVYHIKQDRWIQPEIKGIAPDMRFGHSQTVKGDDIFYFGGAQVDDPVNVIFDDLHKLTYNAIEDNFYWSNYKSPEAYSRARLLKLKAKRNIQQSIDEDMHIDDGNLNRRYTATSSEGSIEDVITTTGQSPRERLEATMILVGSHKLAIFAGVTIVPASQYDETYDEYCAYNTSAVDVFDFRHNHWTRINVTGSGSAVNTFIVESCCAYIAPPGVNEEHYVQQSTENEAWQFKHETKKDENMNGRSNGDLKLDIGKTISSSNSSISEEGDRCSAIYGPTAEHVKAAAVGTVQKSPTDVHKSGSMILRKKADAKGSWMTFYSRDNQVILASTTAMSKERGNYDSQSPDESLKTESSESVNMMEKGPGEGTGEGADENPDEMEALGRKRQNKTKQVDEIVFDEDKRREYLTGFRKRKQKRLNDRREKAVARDKEAKKQETKELRAHRKTEAKSNYENYESQWKTQEEEEDNKDNKESNKQRDDAYEDDKTYAQVSVVEDFSMD
ncbi:hypothetical protein E3P88_00832 [Wallemia ichthyophaga]|uniref:AA9 family lytic polysaccharide monooxygenase n=2 Tax=Wallemia ichthyophaga TaxID=245174 RepID=A0A4T0GAG9_WALIC|nr:hypothetical protein E3P95_02524 [Wallemia ichthyophaga]TIB15034.1 hypothetical protein E3P90_00963 [Wallemia ichthyophaga]TIB16928.1 hypothetical protein E3P93_00820 [Wallemia ichthyophaga]TIB26678.1 hypothetical protein E3P88_00832 [Wallemia ichthyophaga]